MSTDSAKAEVYTEREMMAMQLLAGGMTVAALAGKVGWTKEEAVIKTKRLKAIVDAKVAMLDQRNVAGLTSKDDLVRTYFEGLYATDDNGNADHTVRLRYRQYGDKATDGMFGDVLKSFFCRLYPEHDKSQTRSRGVRDEGPPSSVVSEVNARASQESDPANDAKFRTHNTEL